MRAGHLRTTYRCVARIIAAAILFAQAPCIPLGGTEFRDAALPAIQTGVNSILDGLVAGVFAAIEPDPLTDDGANAS